MPISGPLVVLPSTRRCRRFNTWGLGRDALGQGHFHGDQHGLLIVVQDQCQDIDHLPVSARPAEHQILQLAEGCGQLREGSAIAQCPRLALDDRQIVPPVVDCARRQVMGPLDQPRMLTQNLGLGGHDKPIRIDPQADRAVRE